MHHRPIKCAFGIAISEITCVILNQIKVNESFEIAFLNCSKLRFFQRLNYVFKNYIFKLQIQTDPKSHNLIVNT
jgi:hypothetical protein